MERGQSAMEMANRRSKEMVNSTSEKSSLGIGNTVVEDKTVKSDHADDEEAPTTTSMEIINKQVGGHVEREAKYSLKLPSPTGKDKAFIKQEDDEALRSAKAEMGEVREENERLKLLLSRIVKDYQSLQMHFLNTTLQKEEPNEKSMDTDDHKHHEETSVSEVDELVSLSLGRTSSSTMTDQQYQPRKDNEIHKKNGNLSSNSGKDIDGDQVLNEAGLALELGCRFEPAAAESTEIMMKNSISSDNSSGVEPKEEDPTEIWPPSKMLKTARSGDDEVSQQTQLKKARVSIRARCDAPTMNDGCQWRKYGQKIAKGNPCPRAYYRCTVSPSCPVRKQVQRCADDMSILITTYEGTHNHPLPISATAMASTTSAAASMLQSHSSTSEPGFMNSATAPLSTSTHSNLHGLNFTSISQNTRPPHHFYFPNSSITTTNSHPTITLDLTTPSSSSHFGRFPSSGFSSTPRSYPSTCLNFSSSSSSSLDHMNTLLQAPNWNNNHTAGYFNYGALLSQNRSSINQVGSSLNIGKNPFQEPNNFYQSYTQQHQKGPHQQFLTETIATATKAITSNPKFQSALAAALTSFVGNGGGSGDVRENHSAAGSTSESSGGIKLKWGEPLNGIGCASSYLNKSS